MIDVIKQTPAEYSKQSRDYQVLARLYTALYNINKMYIDNMSVWDNDIDNKLTTLRARTLNFIPKHSWDLDDLDAAISCFKYIMRKKGTITAIKFCLTILLRIRKLTGVIDESAGTLIIDDKNNFIEVRIPTQLASAGVIEDLFNYLLPAGMTYRITEYKSFAPGATTTDIAFASSANINTIKDSDIQIYGSNTVTRPDLLIEPGSTIYDNLVVENTTKLDISSEGGEV